MHARDGGAIQSTDGRLSRWLPRWSSAPSRTSSRRCGFCKIQHALPQLSGQLRRRTDRRARLPNTPSMLASRRLHRLAARRALVAVGRRLFAERSFGAPVPAGTLSRAPQIVRRRVGSCDRLDLDSAAPQVQAATYVGRSAHALRLDRETKAPASCDRSRPQQPSRRAPRADACAGRAHYLPMSRRTPAGAPSLPRAPTVQRTRPPTPRQRGV
jgi:hypothetical protein